MSSIFENDQRKGLNRVSAFKSFSRVCEVVNAWRKKAGPTDVVPIAIFSPGTEAMGDQTASKRDLLWANSLAWY